MGILIDLTGKKFGYLTVINRDKNTTDNKPTWLCKCACGKTKVIRGASLTCGDTKSCGCLNIQQITKLAIENNTTHDCSKKKIYSVWKNMRQRCLNKKSLQYQNYGARGIKICERWLNFENFLADMGHPPSDRHTIERVNNNGDYEPQNCIWILLKFQAENRRSNRPITFNGTTRLLKDWARITGIHRRTISSRLNKLGWSIKDALTIKPD